MNSEVFKIHAAKGDVVCRPTTWTDVVKFFLLNYGLHAFTVITPPGSGIFSATVQSFTAILLPFSSTHLAVTVIIRCAMLKKDKLERAAKAGALCMVVPLSSRFGLRVSPSLTSIHGQQPVPVHDVFYWLKHPFIASQQSFQPTDNEAYSSQPIVPGPYKLVRVPYTSTVRPILGSQQGDDTPIEIACTYSFLKTFVAIIQIFYGSFELYGARGTQIERFGYAAYSLTVIPYILMSFLNLIASLCQPNYPSMYIVYYRGEVAQRDDSVQEKHTRRSGPSKVGVIQGRSSLVPTQTELEPRIDHETTPEVLGEGFSTDVEERMKDIEKRVSGAVGYTYCIPSESNPWKRLRKMKDSSFRNEEKTHIIQISILAFIMGLSLAAPYIVIYSLTGFQTAQSTTPQRAWIFSSLVLGQAFWMIIFYLPIRPMVFADGIFTPVPEDGGSCMIRFRAWFAHPSNSQIALFLYTCVMSVATIGSFVVVSQMMLEDEVCTRL